MSLGAYLFKCLCFRPEGTFKCQFTLGIFFSRYSAMVGTETSGSKA